MNTADFGSKRWHLVYGSYSGISKKAIDTVYRIVSGYVSYIFTANSFESFTEEKSQEVYPIIIGTRESNPLISEFADRGIITIPEKKEGYTIKVTKSIYSNDKQMIVIAGNDENGLLYGCMDFENVYLAEKFYTHKHHPTYFIKPFEDEMPEYERISSPSLSQRGLWTWGHVIYDYKKYLDNMAKLKMNIITIWNDFVPVNAKDVVEYAHSLGIRVIWGYSWGWGEEFDISDSAQIDKWKEYAISTYKSQYAHTGGDGIYFQTFTETENDTINGVVIAAAVTKWVNTISAAMLEEYPDLEIQFGLHASSVKEKLDYIKNIDSRVSIVWEDAGAFPYAYTAGNLEGFENTISLVKEICKLRGNNEKFGSVLKGLICLDWGNFEHQRGNFILGSGYKCKAERRNTIKEIWKYADAHWIKNADKAYEIIKLIVKETKGNAIITALVEDGLFEESIPYSVAILADMLWSDSEDIKDIMCRCAL